MQRAIIVLALTIGAAETYSLPQNAEQQAKFYRDRLAWNRETIVGAYQKVGVKDPRWDPLASQALELAARYLAADGEPPPQAIDVYSAARIAINAGCSDPLIRYCQVFYQPASEFQSPAERKRAYTEAVAALEKSSYPASRRMSALVALGGVLSEEKEIFDQDRADGERALAAAIELMPAVVAEGNSQEAHYRWWKLACQTVACHAKLNGGDHIAAIDKVDAELAKVTDLRATRYLVKGTFLIHKGWADYRAARKDSKNSAEEWSNCCEKLAQARELLNAAWDAHPGDEIASTWMLWVELGIGRERAAMEQWFERAMKANGNNREACAVKLAWLDPRWHGSSEALLEFGKQCRESKNWRAGLTTLAAEAHLYQSLHLESEGKSQAEYFQQPEVWDEIRSVYEEYLSHFPDNHEQRTRFAVFCSLGEQYAEAHRHFQRLGDNVVAQDDFDMEQIGKFRESAAEKVADEGS